MDGTSITRGIGDDGAVVNIEAGQWVLAADAIGDGTHFRTGVDDLDLIGRKSVAINLSDLAAMGARPRFATLTFNVPVGFELSSLQRLFAGAERVGSEFGLRIVGGDTNVWNGPLTVSVTAFGQVIQEPWFNDGAVPGQCIVVTGDLGGSLLGHHLTFTPRCQFTEHVAKQFAIGAATDISDSLTIDLNRVLERSDCGAVLDLDSIPVAAAAHTMHQQGSGLSPLEHALYDGEDFELVLTVDPEVLARMKTDPQISNRLFNIGVVTEDKGIKDRQGNTVHVKGYQHGDE